jgi:hypothetical protein
MAAPKNEKLSHKDFTHQTFLMDDPALWSNTTIVGTCFYQEGDWRDVFPAGMIGVVFERCNLDNCIIPAGNTVVGGCNRNIKVQNDMEDWICDAQGKPTEPLNKLMYLRQGIEPDAKWMPEIKLGKSILIEAQEPDIGR